jgi:hypothetical protein
MLARAQSILHEYGLELEFRERAYRGRTATVVFANNPKTAQSYRLMNFTDLTHTGSPSFRIIVERVIGEGKQS